jgi:hypothetical protein
MRLQQLPDRNGRTFMMLAGLSPEWPPVVPFRSRDYVRMARDRQAARRARDYPASAACSSVAILSLQT